ncbi:MAG: protein kinase [Anaerolineae bacterium]|nr:protein kinase [Anaerolineae bacterium]
MNDLTGQQIDQYRIEALLGEGGMGAVYRARDVHLNRLVALKIMKQSLARQPEFQQRFLQEAQAAARLKHPSIVQIYHFGNRQGLLYMAMAYVPGATLGTYVRRLQETRQILQLSESLSLLGQVAEALGYAHRQGVVHRDIKPDNVLLETLDQPDREGEPPVRAVVTDFGLAKLLEGGVETQTGTFLGTMPYMSPEQCRGRHIDGRSDIYSLGILLYQLATGRLPFEIRTPAEAAEKHIRELPPLPHAIRPGLPAALEALILKAIAKQPEERFQTGEEMARALREQARSDMTVLEAQAVDAKQASVGGTTATVVSLVTQLMPGMSQGIAPSVSSGLAAPAGTDYLIIQRQGEADMTVSLDKSKLTIGRSQGNDIVLDAAGVSRQHARLERTTGGWQILDTGSSNGTFVKSNQLLPNIPEPWEPGQVARLGPFFLRWQPAAGTAVAGQPQWSRTVRAGQSGGAGQTGVTQLLSMDGQLGILVNPTNVDVAAGGRAEIQIELINHAPLVDHFELRLSRFPAEWVTLPPEPVQLMPGGNAALPFTIHPPRHSSAHAGLHPYQLDIYSASTRQRVATINGNINIGPFARYKVEAQPLQLTNQGVCRVTVQNEGNAPATYAVQAREPANALNFFGEQNALAVAPGQAGEVMLRVQPKARPFTGRPRPYTFQVQVQAGPDDIERKQGMIEVRSRVPTWVVLLIPALSIFACLGLIFGGRAYWGYSVGIQQTATAVATQTAIAQTTLSAGEDSDGDGLSNAQEVQLGTNPNNADSDNDGLDDGAEANIHFTNPMNPDSDNDGLRDGEEIGLGTFANVPDSDGDGQLDGIDPDPLATATPTPNAGATQAVMDTQNANATATALALAADNSATSTALALAQQTVSAQQTEQAILAQQTAVALTAVAETAVAQTAEAQQTQAAATATALARLVAHYPLTADATDVTGKQGAMTLTNAPFQNEAVYCNGIYPGSNDPNACVISTPNLDDFNFGSFSIQIEFNADEFRRMPVVVGGRSFRWIGFELNADGSISLLTNNSNRESCTGAYQPGEWHTALLTYDGSVGRLYLDRILRCTVAFNLNHGNDPDVSVINYSNATIFKGHVRELRIFNEPIEPVLIISPPIAVTLLPPIISP